MGKAWGQSKGPLVLVLVPRGAGLVGLIHVEYLKHFRSREKAPRARSIPPSESYVHLIPAKRNGQSERSSSEQMCTEP